ncbi:transcription factor C2H2 [Colletotrichum tofieldiae]|uniref:Transcription factor C2H2 n=1 Tax=Colletotrichum tofieldiae TaxID=708197 RepID=A0A166XKY7_9PEZI|nr:transcription factor C2H2 [Colletotrichum tofieldiae]GKT60687.1 transcription factor C2H2 [Colletotrichum tofieldiae]GKT68389.1 transcription factor C2H2 [Colletotrichum tofieldiae]
MKALVIAALAVCARAAAGQRFAAVDMSPAGGALVPRFFVDAPRLAIRDGGAHYPRITFSTPQWPVTFADDNPGVDIGHPGDCCANTNYCYVKPDNTPWCCPVGSNCDSNCPATAYQCPTTVTRTVSETIMGGAVVTTSLTTSVSSACCGRVCPSASAFRCEARFGGGCCSYGQTCVSSRGCVSTVTAASSATGLLTPIDPGCTATTQHACDDGKGCCDNLWHCTVASGTEACAPGNPTATDVRIVEGGSGGLSAGAKAGIGVGVSVVGCALVGFSAWFCLIKRRRRGTTMSQRSGGASRVSGGVSGLGGGSERPGRSARAMSEVTSGSRPTARRGGTQDYFGPTAVAGPYTETEPVASDGAASTPGRGRGVPLQAHSPSDVVAPVEIDSVGVKRGYGHDVTAVPAGQGAEATPDTTQGRFELYGSELASPAPGMPSPQTQSPPLMTPRSVTSVSAMDRSPGPPSER